MLHVSLEVQGKRSLLYIYIKQIHDYTSKDVSCKFQMKIAGFKGINSI